MKQRLRAGVCELLGTAFMMAFGIGAVVLLWAPGSPVPRIDSLRLRLFATGLLFATGGTLVVYSPLGRVSGGHLNPAVTFGFWRLRRIAAPDALVYVIAQVLGAILGVLVVARLSGALGVSVELGATRPGSGVTIGSAIACEAAITGLLMFLILTCLNTPRFAPYTGIAAGSLVVMLVTIEAPITGTSLNPARSFAPALLTGRLDVVGLYLVAPPLGAWIAARLWRGRSVARHALICAKLYHAGPSPCHLPGCPYVAFEAGEIIVREGDPGTEAFVIETGTVDVRRHGEDGRSVGLARLGPGDWFGEMGVLLEEPRAATIVASSPVRARRLPREAFEQAMADDPAHAIQLMRQLAARLRDVDRRIT